MLSKKLRLTRKEIEEIKSKKTPVLQGRYFGLIFQSGESGQKFALIISNKISKKSTEKNKVKRLFYWALEEGLTDLPPGKYLFLAKKMVLEASAEKFTEELRTFREKVASLLSC